MGFLSSVGSWLGNNVGNIANAGMQLYGASKTADAQKKAAAQQQAAYAQANQQQQAAFQQAQAQQAPYAALGQKASNVLSGQMHGGAGGMLEKFGPQQFQASPGYQYRMQEGVNALDKSAAARGKLRSGGQMKALTDYGQAMGGREYQAAFDRHNAGNRQNYNILAGQLNAGQGASANIGNYMSSAGGVAGQHASNIGLSQSAATVGANNAWNNAYGNALAPFNAQSAYNKYGRVPV